MVTCVVQMTVWSRLSGWDFNLWGISTLGSGIGVGGISTSWGKLAGDSQ